MTKKLSPIQLVALLAYAADGLDAALKKPSPPAPCPVCGRVTCTDEQHQSEPAPTPQTGEGK